MNAPGALRVALVGCHRSLTLNPGSHNWAAAFADAAETEVVAVFDKSETARQEFIRVWGHRWSKITPYDDLQRLLDDQAPDIVCIATRQTMHADQITASVQSGVRGILCDKPLATSLAELDRIEAACASVPLAFGLERRWSVRYRWLRDAMAQGLIGPLREVIAFGAPNLIHHGCHWYDAMMMLAGDPEPRWVSGFVDGMTAEHTVSEERPDPRGRAQIGFANEVAGYVTPGAGGVSFELIGETGRLWVLDDAREVWHWKPPGKDGAPSAMERVAMPTPEPGWPTGRAIVRDLVEAVCRGGRTACDLTQAKWATEIGFAIHLSAAQRGERVPLPARSRSLQIESLPWGNE